MNNASLIKINLDVERLISTQPIARKGPTNIAMSRIVDIL